MEPERWMWGPCGLSPLGPVGGPWDVPAVDVPDVPAWDGSFGGVRFVIVCEGRVLPLLGKNCWVRARAAQPLDPSVSAEEGRR